MPFTRPAALATTFSVLLTLLACEHAPPASRVAGHGVPALDTVPDLVILDTASGGEPRLQFPTGATRLSDGKIVVSDQWAHAVRFFDPTGALVRSVGGRGRGPGKFAAPSWLGQCGLDSIFVWDFMQDRMSVLDSAGSVVRDFTAAQSPTGMRCSREGRLADWGTPARVLESRNGDDATATRFSSALRFENARGDSIGGVGTLPMAEGRILGRVTQYAVTEDRLYVGTAESASLDVYDFRGARVGAIPLSVAERAPSEANVEGWLESRWEMFGDAELRERGMERARQRSTIPERLPLYTSLAVDPDGMIWVGLSSPGDGESRFQVVDPDGALLADLRIPTELEVYEVGRDYLLGEFHAETGIPGIALYRVHWSSGT